MNYEDINEIIISGTINNITDTNDRYIKFSIVAKKYTMLENKNVYVSLNISRELYNTYQDYFIKGNKVFIKGYLNSYIDKNRNIKSFITVTDISNKQMYYSDKVCEQNIVSEERQLEFEEHLKKLRGY